VRRRVHQRLERIAVRHGDEDSPVTAILRNGESVRLDDATNFDRIIPATPGYVLMEYYLDKPYASPIVAWRWDDGQGIMWPIALDSVASEASSFRQPCYSAVRTPDGQIHGRFYSFGVYASETEWMEACRKQKAEDQALRAKIETDMRWMRAGGKPPEGEPRH
jgi:hypothetical protein